MQNVNLFIYFIYRKINFSMFHIFKYMKHKYKLNEFKKSIIDGSPSFGLLWKMADFVKYAELIFFYDNSVKNNDFGLYSSTRYDDGENGFKITTDKYTIVVKLYSESKKVSIELNRLIGDKIRTNISFIDEQWTSNPSIYDEMIIEQIIKDINSRIIKLFNYCYELR